MSQSIINFILTLAILTFTISPNSKPSYKGIHWYYYALCGIDLIWASQKASNSEKGSLNNIVVFLYFHNDSRLYSFIVSEMVYVYQEQN